MKGTVKLRNGIMIDGVEVKEMTYNTEKITVDLYMKALNRAVTKGQGITGTNLKIDPGAHLELGIAAILAENPKYDITDVERITGSDIPQIVDIGMGFTLGREDQTEEPSDQPSDHTPKHTTQTSQDSGK